MSFFSNIFGSRPNYSNVKSPYQQLPAIDPNVPSLTNYASNNIENELQGKLPGDVLSQIQNSGAAWGINTGMPGSQFANNNMLRNLGLNSLSLMQQGQGNYSSFLSNLGNLMMPVSEQVGAANAAAAPNPSAAGLFNTGMDILGMAAGGAIGGSLGGTSAATGGVGAAAAPAFDAGSAYGFTVPSLSYDIGGVGPSAGSFSGFDDNFGFSPYSS